jgi:transcriptional regulator with XRE-family HTH domain
MKKITYGKRLQLLRQKAGMSQKDLAAKAKVDVWTLRKHEQDQRMFDSAFLFAYCGALGIACNEFQGCIPPPPKQRPAK